MDITCINLVILQYISVVPWNKELLAHQGHITPVFRRVCLSKFLPSLLLLLIFLWYLHFQCKSRISNLVLWKLMLCLLTANRWQEQMSTQHLNWEFQQSATEPFLNCKNQLQKEQDNPGYASICCLAFQMGLVTRMQFLIIFLTHPNIPGELYCQDQRVTCKHQLIKIWVNFGQLPAESWTIL